MWVFLHYELKWSAQLNVVIFQFLEMKYLCYVLGFFLLFYLGLLFLAHLPNHWTAGLRVFFVLYCRLSNLKGLKGLCVCLCINRYMINMLLLLP